MKQRVRLLERYDDTIQTVKEKDATNIIEWYSDIRVLFYSMVLSMTTIQRKRFCKTHRNIMAKWLKSP